MSAPGAAASPSRISSCISIFPWPNPLGELSTWARTLLMFALLSRDSTIDCIYTSKILINRQKPQAATGCVAPRCVTMWHL